MDLIGRQIGAYRIISLLGRGGMGEVYRARDATLDRDVAIKVLPSAFTTDPDRLLRFRREARLLASLNHPHIGSIYGFEEHDGVHALVLELVEGDALSDRIAQGRLPIDETLRIAGEIAEALDAAHEKGIIHRDLKPANIRLTPDGHVKVLDFGLAKLVQPSDTAITVDRTYEGAILGTAAYMSPEQARGTEVDTRTDIWAFGCVVYEMLTGRRAFDGENVTDLLVSVMTKNPEWSALPSSTPPPIVELLKRCLKKDSHARFRDIRDARLQIEEAMTSPRRRRAITPAMWMWTVGSAAAIVLAVFVARSTYFHHTPKLTDRDKIVLADFINTTGDPVFDGTLRQGLAIQLGQSPFVSLVSDERIQQALRLMGQPADARLTPEIAKEICERTAGAAVLEGSIASLGSQFVLGLRATNCRTGDVLDEEQVQAARKEDVLNALSHVASTFRTRVGESLATVEKHSTPLAEATTPSLDALKAYSAALKIVQSGGDSAALPLVKRATEIDPQFAMAHAVLARVYATIGESALSAESTGKAYRLRNRTTDAEKFFITASYDIDVTGNLEKAQQTCELWAQTYPRDKNAHGFLAGMIYPVFGKYEKGIAESKKVVEVDPDFSIGYFQLAFNNVYLDRLAEASNALQQASERKLENPMFSIQQYGIAFLKDDRARMEREAVLSRGNPAVEDWMSDQEALVLAYAGRLQQARTTLRRAVDLAMHAAKPESAALYEAGAAVREALFGNVPEATRGAKAALALSKARDVVYGAAIALAVAEDSARAQALADDLKNRFPEDTSVKLSYFPALRARVALNHGEPARAIELLQVAAPYELGVPPSSFIAFYGALYPIYVRGEGYLAAHKGAEAAAEFQKILDHRGLVMNDPIGALAHLQLGRALLLSGDTPKATTAYQDFLTLWKDADSEIPILKQAKAEYSRMR